MKDNEYPQQFTTVAEVELYTRKLQDVSMRHRLEIESLKMQIKQLQETIQALSEEVKLLHDARAHYERDFDAEWTN